MAEIKVSGLDEIGRALAAFGPELGLKYLGRATYFSAAVIRDQAQANAPVRSGQLQDAISVFKRKADVSSAHYAVGVKRIRLNKKIKRVLSALKRIGEPVGVEGDVFYWRFMELGFHDKDGVFHIHPFLKPAFTQKVDQALETFRTELSIGVEKAARAVSANK
jgi:HK97 gp10 family phage protein